MISVANKILYSYLVKTILSSIIPLINLSVNLPCSKVYEINSNAQDKFKTENNKLFTPPTIMDGVGFKLVTSPSSVSSHNHKTGAQWY